MNFIIEYEEYRRDSFDDRICDDLTQVVLSYLTLEDTISFQCVSKQFQSLIFNKQKKLEIRQNIFNEMTICPKTNAMFELNLKAFESILKKCQFINDIVIAFKFSDTEDMGNRVIESITENCNQLKSLDFKNRVESNNFWVKRFGRKFGPKLVNLSMNPLIATHIKQTLIELCPNLVSIRGFELKDLMIGNEVIVLKKLTKVSLRVLHSDEHLFIDFITVYENQLKSLAIQISSDVDISVVIQMVQNCEHLKKLSLDLKNSGSECVEKLWTVLNSLTQLTHLELILKQIHSFNCQSIKELNNIKVLTFHSDHTLPQLYFDGIEYCFPKLEILKLYSSRRKILNNNNLKHLVKSKCLKKLSLSGKTILTAEGLLHVINSNNKLSYIQISFVFGFTDQLIDGLIALTERKPKNIVEIYFSFSESHNKCKFEAISGISCLDKNKFTYFY